MSVIKAVISDVSNAKVDQVVGNSYGVRVDQPNGENVKVIQELMRHASSRSTLEIYSQARNANKRAAQQRVMQMIFPEDLNRNEWVTERRPKQIVLLNGSTRSFGGLIWSFLERWELSGQELSY